MNKECMQKPGSRRPCNGAGAGCHDSFLSRRPVGGEMFLFISPFTERRGFESQNRRPNGSERRRQLD